MNFTQVCSFVTGYVALVHEVNENIGTQKMKEVLQHMASEGVLSNVHKYILFVHGISAENNKAKYTKNLLLYNGLG